MYKYQKIKDLREDNDMTQSFVAKYLDQHITTYQRWERGETEIPCHILIKLCKLYNVSADYMLGLIDLPKK